MAASRSSSEPLVGGAVLRPARQDVGRLARGAGRLVGGGRLRRGRHVRRVHVRFQDDDDPRHVVLTARASARSRACSPLSERPTSTTTSRSSSSPSSRSRCSAKSPRTRSSPRQGRHLEHAALRSGTSPSSDVRRGVDGGPLAQHVGVSALRAALAVSLPSWLFPLAPVRCRLAARGLGPVVSVATTTHGGSARPYLGSAACSHQLVHTAISPD